MRSVGGLGLLPHLVTLLAIIGSSLVRAAVPEMAESCRTVSFHPLCRNPGRPDHGFMVPAQMLKEVADQRSLELRALGAGRPAVMPQLSAARRHRLVSVLARLRPARAERGAAPLLVGEAKCAT